MTTLPVHETDANEKYDQLKKEIEIARGQENESALVGLYRKLGQAYMDDGDAPQALTEFNEALKIVSKGEDKESFAQILGLRGLALKMIGNYSLAMQAFRKSNSLAVEINHPTLACDSFIQIAILHSEMGKIDDTLSSLDKALNIAVEQKDKTRKMRVYGLLGDNFLKQANPAKAAEYFQMAYETAQDLKNRAAEVSFITKSGNVHLLEGKMDRAIEKYERALSLASALEDRGAEINILGGLFRAYALAGDAHPATVYGEQAIHLAAGISHFEAEIANIQALASFLIEQGQAEKALPHLERGIQVAREQVNPGWEMELLRMQGEAHLATDQVAQALMSWEAALTVADRLQDEAFMASMLGRIGVVQAENNDLEKSIVAAQQALEIALGVGDMKLAAEQQILLAFNFRDLDQKTKAIQFCKAAIASYESNSELELALRARTLLEELEK
jgi:tetratricopeptide (TPR) repeat protein